MPRPVMDLIAQLQHEKRSAGWSWETNGREAALALPRKIKKANPILTKGAKTCEIKSAASILNKLKLQ